MVIQNCTTDTSEVIRERVNRAREIASARFAEAGMKEKCNAQLTATSIRKFCQMEDSAEKLLHDAFDRLAMSARAHDRIVRVARTIADLDNSDIIKAKHIAEAIRYRSLDKKYWEHGSTPAQNTQE